MTLKPIKKNRAFFKFIGFILLSIALSFPKKSFSNTTKKVKTNTSVYIPPTISLDVNNNTGAGGVNIYTEACSRGWEILDNTNTGALSSFNSPDGIIMSMTITLINPQDGSDEQLAIGGSFPGVLVAGNNTQSLTITNSGSASTNTMRNVLDDLLYKNLAANPNTSVQRQVSIQVVDDLGQASNTAIAYFNVTKASNSGKTDGPLIVFTTDTSVDLFTGLDGSQDSGGTWVDIDASGALTGSNVDVTALSLGGTSFRYDVSASAPCGTSSTTVLVIKMESNEVPIYSTISCGVLTTQYTSALFSGNSDDPIYIFNTGANQGVLEAEAGVSPSTTYNWYIFNSATNSYDNFAVNSTRIQNNLADGGYLVVRNDGGTITEGRAWVWNISTGSSNAGVDDITCNENIYTLNGNIGGTTQTYTHYDPVRRPFFIDNTTQISVRFNGNHTYVSDLGFYFVDPTGTKTITLAANQGNTCNAGDNISNLTFTNQGSPTYFNFCAPAVSPLTGTWNGYYDGSSNNLIDWSALYGSNAAAGGWSVQIYDCVGADVGALTGATITFDDGSGNVITYTSGSINVPINDNSCSAATASIYEVPFTPAVSASQTIDLNPNIGDNSNNGGWQWYYSVEGASGPFVEFNNNSLTPTLAINQNTWIKLVVNYGFTCNSEDVILIQSSASAKILTTGDQPQDISVNSGTQATFSVNVTGSSISYQWQVDNQLGSGFVNIDPANVSDNYTGSDTATLILNPTSTNENNYEYRVIITDVNNVCPDIISDTAVLTVIPDTTPPAIPTVVSQITNDTTPVLNGT
ncbi:hypothetical protein, partial [Cellulophaga tyrosinoxydans]